MSNQSDEEKLKELCNRVKDQDNLDRLVMIRLLEKVLKENPQLTDGQALHPYLDDQALYNGLFLAASERKKGNTKAVRDAAQSLLKKLVVASERVRDRVRQAFIKVLNDTSKRPAVRCAAIECFIVLVKKNAELVDEALVNVVSPIAKDKRANHAAPRHKAEALKKLLEDNQPPILYL